MIKKRILSMLVLLLTAAMSAVAQLYAPPGSGGDEKTITLSPNNLTLTVGEEATVSYSLSGMGTCIPSWRITEGGSYISFKSLGSGNPKTVIANAPGTATIECYHEGWTSGYCTVTVTAPATYTVTLKEGTEDAGNWSFTPTEATTTGVAAGTEVKATYGGAKKVKSVKAKKKAAAEPAGPTAYTLAESTQGMIVGTDGKAYDVADKDNLPTGVTAAGMVAYKNGSNGLVIALADEASTMYWSTANGETGAAAHTPTVTGYSWRLPSMDEWKQMFGANGGNNESYTGLNTAINTAGGTALLVENGIYWTCTETAYSGHYIAFLNANVSFFMDDDNNANRIRACIAF